MLLVDETPSAAEQQQHSLLGENVLFDVAT